MNLKDFLKNHQQQIVLVIGYLAVGSLAFGLGQHSTKPAQTPNPPVNYNPNASAIQTQAKTVSTLQEQTNCDGKIKGSSSMIYHMPNGAFYSKTTKPIRCFDTEAEAQSAGFKKSSR
jgi:micrococcal nuclease